MWIRYQVRTWYVCINKERTVGRHERGVPSCDGASLCLTRCARLLLRSGGVDHDGAGSRPEAEHSVVRLLLALTRRQRLVPIAGTLGVLALVALARLAGLARMFSHCILFSALSRGLSGTVTNGALLAFFLVIVKSGWSSTYFAFPLFFL